MDRGPRNLVVDFVIFSYLFCNFLSFCNFIFFLKQLYSFSFPGMEGFNEAANNKAQFYPIYTVLHFSLLLISGKNKTVKEVVLMNPNLVV